MVQAAVLKVVVLLCAALLQLAAAQSGPFHAHHHTRSYRLCLIQLDTRVVDNVQQNDASNLDTDLESNDASQGPRADNEDKFTKNCIRPSMLINRYARCWTRRMDVCQICARIDRHDIAASKAVIENMDHPVFGEVWIMLPDPGTV